MVEKIRKTIREYQMLDAKDRVVMGISGGADSVALLLALCRLREEFSLWLAAVHVNHGIRGDAAKGDAEYVERLCRTYGVPFFLFEENIPEMAKKQGKSEEEMGREYRYQCFFRVLEEMHAGKLAVAHHMDDQAETVLFHLIRGTGLSGMRGMLPVNGKVIRPLINCRKEELADWLRREQVPWREDATNREDICSRNRLRNRVFPELEKINAQTVAHVCRLAKEMQEYEQFFRQSVSDYVERNAVVEGREGEFSVKINRKMLAGQPEVMCRGVIYELLALAAGKKRDFTEEHVQAVCALLAKQSGRKISLPCRIEALVSYENLIIRKCLEKREECWQEKIELNRLLAEAENGYPAEQKIVLPGGAYLGVQVLSAAGQGEKIAEIQKMSAGNFKNPYAKFFDCDTIKGTLYIRTPQPEDYLVINQQGGRKSLSRYFKDVKLPADKRKARMIVADGSEVLWVLGGRRSEKYRIQDDTRHVLMLTYEGEIDELSY
ncbi:MAG: tRNA lysidine(34) synthetase TilS [Bacteroidales bacterium]|nr:tRNA lysidine(34) synthetase TilS [Clostridium sp.]MCM1203336.1 tRNA lysidine(34) synthetase TilS [Bacteroidales bacterium]